MGYSDLGKDGLEAVHIATNLANYEAARSGFFTFIVSDLQNIVKASYNGMEPEEAGSSDRIYRAEEYLKLNVTKASVPQFKVTPLEYKRGNEVVKFAGVPTFDAGRITVDDIVGIDTKSILMAWQALAYNVHNRRGGRMINYKKTCTLAEYTQDYELIRTWTLYGCWISDITDNDFDKTNDGKRELQATIQYDRATMELSPDFEYEGYLAVPQSIIDSQIQSL